MQTSENLLARDKDRKIVALLAENTALKKQNTILAKEVVRSLACMNSECMLMR